MLRVLDLRIGDAEFGGRKNDAGQSRGAGGFRTDKIGFIAFGPGPSGEVAVEGAERDGAVCRALSLTDAGAASGLQNPGAGGDDVGQSAVPGEHFENLPASRSDRQRHILADFASFEHSCHQHQIAVGAVRAGADDDLPDFGSFKRRNGFDVVGTGGTRRQLFEFIEIDFDHAVIFGIGIGRKRDPVRLSSLRGEEFARHGVGRENGTGHAELRAHVGDRCALGNGQRADPFPEIFNHAADISFRRKDFEHLQNDVFRGDPVPELSGQFHADDLGERQTERLSGHGQSHIQSARADRHHADSASGRRVRVGPEQRLSRDPIAFQVHLVTDSVSGPGEENPLRRRHTLQIQMIVPVFRSVLHHVVIDVGDRKLRGDLFHPHRLQFQISHGSGCILGKRLIDPDGDGCSRALFSGDNVTVENFLNQRVLCHILKSLVS